MKTTLDIILRETALAIGLPAEKLIDKPVKPGSLLLPDLPRIEVETLTEVIHRHGKIYGWEDLETGEIKRKHRVFKMDLKSRVVIRADDEGWLESAKQQFMLAIPYRYTTSSGEICTLKVEQATRGGYQSKGIEVFKERTVSFVVTLSGGYFKEETVGVIQDLEIEKPVVV